MNAWYFFYLRLLWFSIIALFGKQIEDFLWNLNVLFQLDSITIGSLTSLFFKMQQFVLFYYFLHYGPWLIEKFLELDIPQVHIFPLTKPYSLSFVLKFDVFLKQLFWILILWLLRACRHRSRVICLHFLINHFVVGGHNLSFDYFGLQFVSVNVLRCLWNHLEHIELLLLAELKQLAQFFSPDLLSIDSHVVYLLGHNEALLLHEAIKIIIELERIVTSALELVLWLLVFLSFAVYLPLLKLICLLLLPRHRLSYSFHLVLTVIDSIILKVLLIVIVTGILALHIPRRWHLLECTVLAWRRIWLHPGLRPNVWPLIHLVHSEALLGAQNLITTWQHLCLVCVWQRPLIPLIVCYSLSHFLFQDLWSKMLFLNQSLSRCTAQASSWYVVAQSICAVFSRVWTASVRALRTRWGRIWLL